jgi:hypothetical protein
VDEPRSRRYRDKPKRLARAQRREEHVDATWRAWREALFDLIASKPHLPSVAAPKQGTDGQLAVPSRTETAAETEPKDSQHPQEFAD